MNQKTFLALTIFSFTLSQGNALERFPILRASDGGNSHYFGSSVSLSGSQALVGSPKSQSNNGAAYLFKNLGSTSGFVTEDAKIIRTDGASEDRFGDSVSVSGNGVLITASGYGPGIWPAGRAYYYPNAMQSSQGSPTPLISSTAQAGDYFGYSGSLSGTSAVIGARGVDSSRGAAYLYRLSSPTSQATTQHATLLASDGMTGDTYGWSATIVGNTAIFGAINANLPGGEKQGAAYLFRGLQSATGTTYQNAKLIAVGVGSRARFGSAVSLSGGRALIAAENAKSVYLFRDLNTTTDDLIYQSAKLRPANNPHGHVFGASVSLFDNDALVGAYHISKPGLVYLFRGLDNAFGTDASPTTESVEIRASYGGNGDFFGGSVSFTGDRFLIGASQGDGGSQSPGRAYYGTTSAFTVLNHGDVEHAIDNLSFRSREDWVIGAYTNGNKLTLQPGNAAEVMSPGAAVYIGRHAGSNANRLVLSGALDTAQVYVGSLAGNENNVLEFTAVSQFAGVESICIASKNGLLIPGNLTNPSTLLAYLGGTTLQVFSGGSWTTVHAANASQLLSIISVQGKTSVMPRQSPYAKWVANYFPVGDPRAAVLADADGDNYATVFEYLFNTNPDSNNEMPNLEIARVPGGITLDIRVMDRSDLHWDVQVSSDLQTWTDLPPTSAVTLQTHPDGSKKLRFSATTGPTKGFARIRIKDPLPL